MKKTVKKLICLMSAVCISAGMASAETVYNIEVSYEEASSTVTVSGSIADGAVGEKATLIVLKPADEEKTLADMTDANAAELIFTVKQSTVKEDGSFSFEYKWDKTMTGGEFVYKVAVSGDEEAEENRTVRKYFISDGTILQAVTAVNNAATGTEMAAALSRQDFEFETDPETIVQVAEKFMLLKGENQLALDEIKTILESAEIYCDTDSGRLTSESLEKYFADKGIELPESYSENKDKILKLINGNTYEAVLNDDGLKAVVQEATAVTVINNSGRETLSANIEKYKTLLGIDTAEEYTKYAGLSAEDKIKCNISLTGKNFKTADEIKTAFITAAGSYTVDVPVSSGISAGSGGSAGGGKKSTVSMPVIKTEELPKAEEIYKITFADLSKAEWAREAIEKFAEAGFVDGISESEFAPEALVTREAFLKILINSFGFEMTEEECDFTDCDKNAWYYPYVAYGVKSGLVKGISEDRFGIGQPITRQDLCVMVYRAAELKGIDFKYIGGEEFKDEDEIAEYAAEAVTELAGSGIVNGKGGGFFEPKSNASRAEAVVIMYRASEIAGK